MGAVDEPIEDGVGDRGVAEGLVPVTDRQLAGDDRGAGAGPVLDDLQQVGCPGSRHGLQAQVVEDQHVHPGPGRHEPGQATVGPRQHELVEQPGHPPVEGRVAAPDGGVGEGAGEEGLAHARRPRHQHVPVRRDPLGVGEGQHRRPVEPPRCPQVEVLDDRVAAELRGLQVAGEATVLAILRLPVDQQAEALLERECRVVGVTLLVHQRPRHAAQGEGVELVDGRRDEHRSLLHS